MLALLLKDWPVLPPARQDPLARLSISLSEGSLGVLHGPSGSGKTTALRALSGLGEYKVPENVEPGFSLFWGNPKPLRDGTLHFMPDRPGLPLDWFGGDIIMEMAALCSLPVGASCKAMHDFAIVLGVEEKLGRRASTYSRGEAARVALLRMLIQPRGLLLLDEPSAHLDAGARASLRACLKEWAISAPRRAILMASHHLDDASQADSAWEIGRVIA
jgi:ATP-binding cassette subfamily C protein CydD